MLLSTSLVVLCGLYVVRILREAASCSHRIAGGFALLGLASGFALASKHTSALIIVPVYLAGPILLFSSGKGLAPEERRHLRVRCVFGWLGSGLLGIAVFYLLMPVWWFYPLHWLILLCLSAACFAVCLLYPRRRAWMLGAVPLAVSVGISFFIPRAWAGIYQPIRIIAQTRAELIKVHETLGMELPTFASRIGELADQLLFAETQYYESLAWDGLEEEQLQIRIYEDSRLDGRGGGTAWGIVVSVLAVIGLWTLLLQRRGWEGFFLFLWLSAPAAILLMVNSLAWQRYYLILIAPWSVLAGFAAAPLTSPTFLGSIRRFLMRKVPRHESVT